MARRLTADDLEPALVGGLFLSAGGSGKRSAARALALGRMALDYGGIRLVTLDELERDDPVITATAIGAPGVADPAVTPRSGTAGAALADTAETPRARAPATRRADTRIRGSLHRTACNKRNRRRNNSARASREPRSLV